MQAYYTAAHKRECTATNTTGGAALPIKKQDEYSITTSKIFLLPRKNKSSFERELGSFGYMSKSSLRFCSFLQFPVFMFF